MKLRLPHLQTILGNLALLAGSLLFMGAVIECLLRMFFPQPLGLRSFTREGAVIHTPDSRIRYTRQDFSNVVSINAEGLRDRYYPPGKPAGVFRVLVLGDSYTDGLQVADGDVWVKRAEKILNGNGAQAGQPGSIELVNAGLAGSGTYEELHYLELYGERWRPDLVLLAFYWGNDVSDNLENDRAQIENGRLVLKPRQPLSLASYETKRLRSWIGSHSHLYQLFRWLDASTIEDAMEASAVEAANGETGAGTSPDIAAGSGAVAPLPGEGDARLSSDLQLAEDPPREETIRGWDLTFALLDRMESEAQAISARFSVVVLSPHWSYDPVWLKRKIERKGAGVGRTLDPSLPGRMIGDWASKRQVPMLDLRPAFVERGMTRADSFAHDGHWKEHGHQVAAEEIARFLRDSGAVPPPSAPQ